MSIDLVRIFRAKITGVEADFVDFDREGEYEIFCGFFVGFANFGGLAGGAGNESFWSIVDTLGVRCGFCARRCNLEMRTKLEKECGGIIGVGFEQGLF